MKRYEENEDTVMWREHKKDIQNQHAEWRKDNLAILSSSGIKFGATNNGECLVFRLVDYPQVDFYPSTGRWRDIKSGRTYNGGAKLFISWYKSHSLTNG